MIAHVTRCPVRLRTVAYALRLTFTRICVTLFTFGVVDVDFVALGVCYVAFDIAGCPVYIWALFCTFTQSYTLRTCATDSYRLRCATRVVDSCLGCYTVYPFGTLRAAVTTHITFPHTHTPTFCCCPTVAAGRLHGLRFVVTFHYCITRLRLCVLRAHTRFWFTHHTHAVTHIAGCTYSYG